MVFDWKEYLVLAESLQISEVSYSREAADRTAVSRAYYAAYCHARNYARDQNEFVPTKSSNDHARVRKHFMDRGEITVAQDLDQLRQWRNDCDYDDQVPNISMLLTSAIDQAKNVIAILK